MLKTNKENLKFQLKKAMLFKGIENLKELAQISGIKYQTLLDHIQRPDLMSVYELQTLDEVLEFPDDVLVAIIRGIKD